MRATSRVFKLSAPKSGGKIAEIEFMASVLLPSDGDSAFERESSTKDTSEHPCKRSKHSALNNVSQLFQQVCMTSRAMWQNIASDCGPVCVAQVVQKLEASRQRSSNWTVFEEFALLCEAWSRAARREPSAAFAFNGRSAKAVNNKLTWLKSILPSEIINLPSCTPAELLGDTLARCKLLASKQGRTQLIGDLDATTWEGASEADLASESVQS